jgi:hypothetical protein
MIRKHRSGAAELPPTGGGIVTVRVMLSVVVQLVWSLVTVTV